MNNIFIEAIRVAFGLTGVVLVAFFTIVAWVAVFTGRVRSASAQLALAAGVLFLGIIGVYFSLVIAVGHRW